MSGMSSTSFLFSEGNTTVSMPALWAASTFSFTPPMGSTRPLSVISPVIATFFLTALPVRADTIAVASVMPAEGPSLGVAPSGTWIWMSYFLWNSVSIPSNSALERMKLTAAIADSFITSPSCPVSSSFPLPSMMVTSIASVSPPTGVHASPVARPTSSFSLALSYLNLLAPRYFSIFDGVIVTDFLLPDTSALAAFLQRLAISLSRFLTPASLV